MPDILPNDSARCVLPSIVDVELNALLGGQTVYTDAWRVDYPWIRTLFQVASINTGS